MYKNLINLYEIFAGVISYIILCGYPPFFRYRVVKFRVVDPDSKFLCGIGFGIRIRIQSEKLSKFDF
jgi:hypothetical protein